MNFNMGLSRFYKSFCYISHNVFRKESTQYILRSTLGRSFATSLPGARCDLSLKFSAHDLTSRMTSSMDRWTKSYDFVGTLQQSDVTYENVIKVLQDLDCEVSSEMGFLELVQNLAVEKSLRDAASEATKKMHALAVEIGMRKDIFKNLLILENQIDSFKPEVRRYLEHLIRSRKRNGLHLSDEIQTEIKKLQNRMSVLCVEFGNNINNEATILEFSSEELNGMSEDFLSRLSKNPDTDKFSVSLKYPDVFPVMQRCKVPHTRYLMEKAFSSRCIKENMPLLQEFVQLTHKHARLLGYKNHTSYVTEELMAKSEENVRNFLHELKQRVLPLWHQEKQFMLELKEKECNELNINFDGKLNMWDMGYYSDKVKQLKYSVDQEKVKEYFQLPKVIDGVLSIYQEVLGLQFTEIPNLELWHEDVQAFQVTDAKSKDLLGYFFLDLFPRDGKYTHAAHIGVQPSCVLPDGSRQAVVGVVVANMQKPLGKDKPSLMEHNDVLTFFHEFGHATHHLCSKTESAYFSGTRVEMDFVETPSQMLENWGWNPDLLNFLSCHHKNGTKIPDEMSRSLVNARLANVGFSTLRTIAYSLYDHTLFSDPECNIKELSGKVIREILGLEKTEGTDFGASFNHLLGGYDAQYYSYLWSEVYSLDMFYTHFKGNDLRSPKTGMDYRRKILEPGGTKDGMDLLKDFLGRPPNQDAFLESKGLKI